MKVLVLIMILAVATAWPGMKSKKVESDDYIGPACTVGAHNWHPESGPCPNMDQPPAPGPYSNKTHVWPNQFIVDWKFFFVPDDSDAPPYTPYPKTAYNVTTGKTYYEYNPATGQTNMKEVYDEYCIPVFGDPTSSMGNENKYSCDFLNVGNISYVVLHKDRPADAPECCIIGKPFHAPPPDFAKLMPTQWSQQVGDVLVDWSVLYDKDAGIFSYGFRSETDNTPFAFYMKGVPWIANWMWQTFENFRPVTPPFYVWIIPEACHAAVACPGWEPGSGKEKIVA
jgi:hypothetical protein